MPDSLVTREIDPIDLTQALIRCPSVTPVEGGALELLARTLEPLGFRCERMDFSDRDTPDVANLYARLGSGGRHFCFAGHTDVVPVGDPGAWTIDPFAATIENGTIWGRGASDMKSAIAAFVVATSRFLARRGRDFGGSISLMITGDEEGPSINGTRKMLERLAARNETIDACVVGEPTNPMRLGEMMKIGRRGSINIILTVRGIQGHVAYPHLVDNPIHRLTHMIEALVRTPLDQGSAHFQPSSLQVTTVDVGNPTENLVPGKVEARFNIRFNDRWTSKTLLAEVHRRLQAAHESLGGNGTWETTHRVSGESFYTPPGELSGLLAEAIREITGVDPELSTSGGTSDARFIRSACPVVEFGIVGETMHKVDERCSVADVHALARIYERLLDRYFNA